MANTNQELLEAVRRLKQAEEELRAARIHAATLFDLASRRQPVTSLARLTDIHRTRIYWLINTWSTEHASNDISGIDRGKAS